MKDLGMLHYFLGISVTSFAHSLFLHKMKYALDLLNHAHMQDCKPASTPMVAKASACSTTTSPFPNGHFYRSIVGGLQYLTFTRPDITFSVNYVCQFMHQPTMLHFQMVKIILCYVKGTLYHGVQLASTSSLHLYAFSNSNWARCPDIDVLPQVFVPISEAIAFLGVQRSNPQLLDPVLKLNIKRLLLQRLNSHG